MSSLPTIEEIIRATALRWRRLWAVFVHHFGESFWNVFVSFGDCAGAN